MNERDILNAVSVNEILDTIEDAMLLYERKDFLMPDRMHIDYDRDNVLLLMPCFTNEIFGTKLVSLFARNAQKGVPVLNGIVVLNDIETGVPLALMNGPVLTALRTAAVAGVSIRYLADKNAESLGVLGAGVQGFYQAWLGSIAGSLKNVYVFDIDKEKSNHLAEKLIKLLPDAQLRVASSTEDLLQHTQVVITATTSMNPVLPDNPDLLKDKHFVGIGSYKPTVREFPQALYSLIECVFIDTDHALHESGDIIVPIEQGWIKAEQVQTLGKFLLEQKNIEAIRTQTTFFKSVGMALFDVCAGKLVYERAKEKGLGQNLEL